MHVEGGVTIPQGIRERTGLLPNTEVDFLEDEAGVRVPRRPRQDRERREGPWPCDAYEPTGPRSRCPPMEIMALTRGDG